MWHVSAWAATWTAALSSSRRHWARWKHPAGWTLPVDYQLELLSYKNLEGPNFPQQIVISHYVGQLLLVGGEALDFTVVANEFSKQFVTVLVSQKVFLFMESHTAPVDKLGQGLILETESKSLSTAWFTSIWLMLSSFPHQSRHSASWQEYSIWLMLLPTWEPLPGRVLAGQAETALKAVKWSCLV